MKNKNLSTIKVTSGTVSSADTINVGAAAEATSRGTGILKVDNSTLLVGTTSVGTYATKESDVTIGRENSTGTVEITNGGIISSRYMLVGGHEFEATGSTSGSGTLNVADSNWCGNTKIFAQGTVNVVGNLTAPA